MPIEFKLADFGVSRDLSNKKQSLQQENVAYRLGTPRYMAPEQNVNKPLKDAYKVEVFSIGVIMFKLLFKAFPFTKDSINEEGRNPRFLDHFIESDRNINRIRLSPECMELLKSMLAYNQSDRCTLSDIIASEWFDSCHQKLKQP